MILALAAAVIWISAFDSNRFTVSEYEFTDARIVKPLKIVFLSDLHCKMYGYGGTFLLERIREINPGLILIGGDMITAYPGHETEKVSEFLKKLNGDYPVIYSFGNHELRLKIYPEKYGQMWEGYTNALSGFGMRILENEVTELPESGVNVIAFSADRKYYKRFAKEDMDPGYISGKVGKPAPDRFNILLAHDPFYFKSYASYGAELTLSGHVHGGIARIPVPVSKDAKEKGAHVMRGVISPRLRLFPKYDSGRFDEDGRTMIISRGLGTHSFPIRVFNPGDLVVIDLKPENGV
ncbi:MAG: metallophosphoesterase [Lachnospiraceae bacterium]|nr:metallophosphoesterase [Lachnospiraceae bacterium]